MTQDEIFEKVKLADGMGQVPDEQLKWMIAQSKIILVPAGEYLFKRHTPADNLYIVLMGHFRMYIEQEKGQREFTDLEPGDVTGILPYSRMVEATAFAQAREDATVLAFHKDYFNEMIKTRHALTQACVHLMTARIREFTTLSQQNEKMTALGKLSAGLAHELNNPSAAIIRSAQELKKNLKASPTTFKKVVLLDVTPAMVDQVNTLLFEKLQHAGEVSLTLMQRSQCEDELADWMEDNEVENGFELASNFVDFGFETEDLEKICDIVGKEGISVVLNWISNNLVTEKLVDEIESASKRIAELVGSVKTYSHMDQAPDRHPADIHEGIKSTLTMLNHKVKKLGVTLKLDFDETLPKIPIFVSELNQLWTNLIDNALDALEESLEKTLSIQTKKDIDRLTISITDSGSGIPKEIIDKIFDPFFTTKEVGKGTGLGLEIGRNVVLKHGGTITVSSVPGKTEFVVKLPM